MRSEILNNINNPKELEKLFRNNKVAFKKEFNQLYPELTENRLAEFWYERLNFETQEISWGSNEELFFVILASIVAGLFAKIPATKLVTDEFFYPRNLGFVIFPLLTTYFAWKNKLSMKKNLFICVASLIGLVYINLLPNNNNSHTLVLSCIHLPLFLWTILGVSFVGKRLNDLDRRLDFLRYNGDLTVITALILIGGMLLTGITIGLFSIIEIEIGKFYFEYIVVWGLAASPIVGTFVIQTNPQLVSRVSPIIAKIFSPLVLITLLVYLVAIIESSKDPYNDRDFLLIFNFLLIGVMAIILFSISESSKNSNAKTSELLILFMLSILTTIINVVALSAILFRISEWGISPNKLAVLGGNVLILTNLLIVIIKIFHAIRNRIGIEKVEKSISAFLPIYSIWTVIVTFLFPIIFSFK